MPELQTALENRWRTLFQRLAAGADLPPGQRLRTEGMMEAAALLAPGSEAQLTAAMDAVYRQVNGRSLAQDFGDDWQMFSPFPEIPAVASRAPVYPSTRD